MDGPKLSKIVLESSEAIKTDLDSPKLSVKSLCGSSPNCVAREPEILFAQGLLIPPIGWLAKIELR